VKTALLFFSVFYSIIDAALPPFSQSVREIEAILSDPRLYQLLGGAEPIQEIQRGDAGYIVTTKNQTVEVVITYLPLDRPGPAKFTLQFLKQANS